MTANRRYRRIGALLGVASLFLLTAWAALRLTGILPDLPLWSLILAAQLGHASLLFYLFTRDASRRPTPPPFTSDRERGSR